jgi:hypothetical protein
MWTYFNFIIFNLTLFKQMYCNLMYFNFIWNLNLNHFKTIQTMETKIIASMSPRIALSSYQISWKSGFVFALQIITSIGCHSNIS